MSPYLALVVGNSRLHWALLQGFHGHGDRSHHPSGSVVARWDTAHSPALGIPDPVTPADAAAIDRVWLAYVQGLPLPPLAQAWLQPQTTPPPLVLASVVPAQAALFHSYPQLYPLSLSQIPLGHAYSNLGLDRALGLWGAGHTYGWPALVIDGGTALTLTGGDGSGNLVGGAILPGLRLQFQSLSQGTAALPWVDGDWMADPPPRWARDTTGAIASGVLYGVLGAVQGAIDHWLGQFPHSEIVFTGGDGQLLWSLAQEDRSPGPGHPPGRCYHWDPDLLFKGILALGLS
ncbi:hypothetical protein PROH_09880 [Prochlorothrix hollandica PCC 9006 = CALU 1027]|uniref:Type III pantothenate kinase n=1 Tax=Prochlorothrix hollandica PCC 9006 = CALU 1027 TaxID=317619 RepID=A0A0M2PWJ1_PROHO|nr:hypothetical protein PROH_09880 [Prochlorothrix hollandica PCC 9006 = CALU 1027]